MSWFEVESKVKILDYEKVKKAVVSISSFVGKEVKSDDYYALHVDGYPKKSFRIRNNGKVFVVNFKKKSDSLSDKEVVVKEEFEFILNHESDVEVFLALQKDLGFKEWAHKKKISEIYSYNKDKNLHFEINKVDKLGYWLEIEYLCHNKNKVLQARRMINEVTSMIGDGLGKIDNTGYTKMLYRFKKK